MLHQQPPASQQLGRWAGAGPAGCQAGATSAGWQGGAATAACTAAHRRQQVLVQDAGDKVKSAAGDAKDAVKGAVGKAEGAPAGQCRRAARVRAGRCLGRQRRLGLAVALCVLLSLYQLVLHRAAGDRAHLHPHLQAQQRRPPTRSATPSAEARTRPRTSRTRQRCVRSSSATMPVVRCTVCMHDRAAWARPGLTPAVHSRARALS